MKIKYMRAIEHPLFRRYTWIKFQSKLMGWPVEWSSFWHFAEDLEDHLGIPANVEEVVLLRKNQSKPYTLNNLTWGTRLEQGHRYSRTRLLTYQRKTLSLAEWSRELNIPYGTLYTRLQLGWPTRKILGL